jgi:outer membrane beta-barrel protein
LTIDVHLRGKFQVSIMNTGSKMSIRFVAGTILALMCLCSPAAFAQSDSGSQAPASIGTGQGPDSVGKPPAEGDDWWSEARGVYVVQKRPFLKQGKFAATLYTGIIPNNIFEQYYPIGARLNYFILENIGIELAGSYNFRNSSGLSEVLEDPAGVSAGAEGGGSDIRLGDRQRLHSSFSVTWSPFYGKMSGLNEIVSYFDLFVVGGVGLAVVENKADPGAPIQSSAEPKGVLGGGFAFYFGDNMAARADFRQFVFQKTGETQSGLAKASEISLGVSYFF